MIYLAHSHTYIYTYILKKHGHIPHIYLVICSMEQNPSQETYHFSVSQRIPRILWNWRFITAFISARHLPLFWAWSIQTLPPNPTSWRSIYILASHLRLGHPSDLLSSGFAPKPCIQLSPIWATWPTCLVLLSLITQNNIWWGVQIIKHYGWSFFQSPVTLSPLCPNISHTLSLRSSLNVSGHVSYPYKTTGKIEVLCILIFIYFDYTSYVCTPIPIGVTA